MPRHRTAVLIHEGGSRYVASTGTNRTIVYGDDVERGELSPVETLMACVAACSAMDVWPIAVKKRQQVSRYEIRVEAIQRDEYPQILTRIDITHVVEGPLVEESAIRRAIELSATKYCPVSAMLSAGATEIHHGYVIRSTGAGHVASPGVSGSGDPGAGDPRSGDELTGEVVVTGPYRRPDIVS